MNFLQDFSKIALFLLLFASIALIFEVVYFRRKKSSSTGGPSVSTETIGVQQEEQELDESASKPFLRGKTLIIIGALVVLLALPLSVYLVFQPANPEKQAEQQTTSVTVCDQVDVQKNNQVVSDTSLKVGDTVSFVGYCYTEGASAQNTITTLRFTAITSSGTVGPFAYLAFTAPEKNHDNRQYVQATYPNIQLGSSGTYTLQLVAYNGNTQVSAQTFSKTFTLAGSQIVNQTPTPTQQANANTGLPVCTSLSAIPLTGPSPLAVSFTGSGSSQTNTVSAFEFTFGDSAKQTVSKNVGTSGSVSTTHVYQNAGSYTASLAVQDKNGNMSVPKSLCSTQITVVRIGGNTATASGDLDVAPTKTATPTLIKLPEAGVSLPMVGFLSAGLVILTFGLLLAF